MHRGAGPIPNTKPALLTNTREPNSSIRCAYAFWLVNICAMLSQTRVLSRLLPGYMGVEVVPLIFCMAAGAPTS